MSFEEVYKIYDDRKDAVDKCSMLIRDEAYEDLTSIYFKDMLEHHPEELI